MVNFFSVRDHRPLPPSSTDVLVIVNLSVSFTENKTYIVITLLKVDMMRFWRKWTCAHCSNIWNSLNTETSVKMYWFYQIVSFPCSSCNAIMCIKICECKHGCWVMMHLLMLKCLSQTFSAKEMLQESRANACWKQAANQWFLTHHSHNKGKRCSQRGLHVNTLSLINYFTIEIGY